MAGDRADPIGLFRRGEVPVVSTGVIVDPDDNQAVAAMVVDARGRRDVDGLVAAHATSGIGDLRCGVGVFDEGSSSEWLVRIEVVVDRPVSCRFHAVLGWAEHRGWLGQVASGGAVAFTTAAGDGAWLRLNVDPRRMTGVLAELDGRSG